MFNQPHTSLKKRPVGFAVALVGSLLVATLTGCSTTSVQAGWTTPQFKTIGHYTATSRLPFDSYALSADDLTRMQKEQATLLSACAKAYGAVLTFGGDYLRPPAGSSLAYGGLFGTMTAAHASSFGYHAGPNDPWAPVPGFYLKDPSNVQPYQTKDPELANIIAFGPTKGATKSTPVDANGKALPKGGCMAVVEKKIGAPLSSDTDLRVQLTNLSVKDSRVRAASSKWITCMKAAGFAYTTTQSAAQGFALAPLTAREVTIATTDVKCTESSQWANTFYTVLAAYERQAIQKDPNVLQATLASQQRRLKSLDSLASHS